MAIRYKWKIWEVTPGGWGHHTNVVAQGSAQTPADAAREMAERFPHEAARHVRASIVEEDTTPRDRRREAHKLRAEGLTLVEVGKRLNVSAERARQLVLQEERRLRAEASNSLADSAHGGEHG